MTLFATRRSTRAISSTLCMRARLFLGRLGRQILEIRLLCTGGRISVARLAARSIFPVFSIPGKTKRSSFSPRSFGWKRLPRSTTRPVPGLKERGLILTPQGIQKNLQTSSNGVIYQAFDFTDVCPIGAAQVLFRAAQYPDCPAILEGNGLATFPNNQLEEPAQPGGVSTFGVDKGRAVDLEREPDTAAKRPYGCNFSLANFNPSSPDRVIPIAAITRLFRRPLTGARSYSASTKI